MAAIGAPVRRSREAPVGSVQIEADVDRGYLLWLWAQGPHVHTAERDSVAAELARNHGGLDDLTRELDRLGARYGPQQGDALVRDLRRNQLEKVFGTFVVKLRRFEWLDTQGANQSASAPAWRVVIEATPKSSTPHCVELGFEPIDGRLTFVLTAADYGPQGATFSPCRLPTGR